MHILGIDVAKAKVDVALTQANEIKAESSFANSEAGFAKLHSWLQRAGVEQLHACLEATGRYGDALARFLHEQAYVVSFVNPSRIADYSRSKLRRNKSDQLDARLIADFCFTQQPDRWTPPSEARRELQELTRYATSLKQDRQRKRNQLQALPTSAALRHSLEKTIDFLEQELKLIEEQMRTLVRSDPELWADVELIESIPGLSTTTALCFLAEVDMSRFSQAPQVAAYAGLVPCHYRSGSSVRKPDRLSKVGNRHLRTAFFMPALSAHRFNPIIRDLRERLQARGKAKMTIVVATMRKLLHLAFGVLKTRQPFDPALAHRTASAYQP